MSILFAVAAGFFAALGAALFAWSFAPARPDHWTVCDHGARTRATAVLVLALGAGLAFAAYEIGALSSNFGQALAAGAGVTLIAGAALSLRAFASRLEWDVDEVRARSPFGVTAIGWRELDERARTPLTHRHVARDALGGRIVWSDGMRGADALTRAVERRLAQGREQAPAATLPAEAPAQRFVRAQSSFQLAR